MCVGGGLGGIEGEGRQRGRVAEREREEEEEGGKTPKTTKRKKQAWQLRGVSMSQPSTAPRCL